jgi:hypothetical protein
VLFTSSLVFALFSGSDSTFRNTCLARFAFFKKAVQVLLLQRLS